MSRMISAVGIPATRVQPMGRIRTAAATRETPSSNTASPVPARDTSSGYPGLSATLDMRNSTGWRATTTPRSVRRAVTVPGVAPFAWASRSWTRLRSRSSARTPRSCPSGVRTGA